MSESYACDMVANRLILKAHLEGDRVVLDEPLPPGVALRSVSVILEPEPNAGPEATDGEEVLSKIAAMAIDDPEVPRDFAAQHDHSIKGAPRKPLQGLVDLAFDDPSLPSDFAAQHEHYVKGTPKKP